MFTGIVEGIGGVVTLSRRADIHRLTINSRREFKDVKSGDSLSINGACLTLLKQKGNVLEFDVMKETFAKTSFRYLKAGDIVNIERALEREARIDGHFVLGHVDSVRKIKALNKKHDPYLDIDLRREDRQYVVKKGSVAIDGISLTVSELFEDRLRVSIIPYTLENTNFKYKNAADFVNVEFDILGKYILKKSEEKKPAAVTENFLKDKGFI